jgi:hypothetical protein
MNCYGTGIPAGVIRFAAQFPIVAYRDYARGSYALVRNYTILQKPPFNPNILRAERMAAKWVRGHSVLSAAKVSR